MGTQDRGAQSFPTSNSNSDRAAAPFNGRRRPPFASSGPVCSQCGQMGHTASFYSSSADPTFSSSFGSAASLANRGRGRRGNFGRGAESYGSAAPSSNYTQSQNSFGHSNNSLNSSNSNTSSNPNYSRRGGRGSGSSSNQYFAELQDVPKSNEDLKTDQTIGSYFPFENPTPPMMTVLYIAQEEFKALLDTGSTISTVDAKLATERKWTLVPTEVQVHVVGQPNPQQAFLGGTTLEVSLSPSISATPHVFGVCHQHYPIIIGRDLILKLHIAIATPLPSALDVPDPLAEFNPPPIATKDDSALRQAIARSLDANNALPANAVSQHPMAKMVIKLKDDSPPYQVPSPPVNANLRHLATQKIQKLLREGRIEPAEPTPYELATFFLLKLSDGKLKDVRMILDCRPLNQLLELDSFPIPDIRQLLNNFANKKVFSELDLTV